MQVLAELDITQITRTVKQEDYDGAEGCPDQVHGCLHHPAGCHGCPLRGHGQVTVLLKEGYTDYLFLENHKYFQILLYD